MSRRRGLSHAEYHSAGAIAARTAAKAAEEAEIDARRIDRHTPCERCGVRPDVHDALGCKRWRG
ncbi:MAG: hypothetical protein LBV50_11405 [Novosphingobium sp.]|jgi:hypothetical protein|nr:hypothetical protein [Novosphingobium sp.]